MKLYYATGACSLAPHIVSLEADLNVELIRVDTKSHLTADGVDFYTINPKGSVPCLQLADGQLLTEGPIICQYLADQSNNRQLMPAAGTLARYRVMEWQNYITSELHKSFSPLFNPTAGAETKALFAEQLKNKYTWLSSKLEQRPYLTGDDFTAADAYLFVVTNWSKFVGLDLSHLSALQAFMQRVAARPAVQMALKAEGLIK